MKNRILINGLLKSLASLMIVLWLSIVASSAHANSISRVSKCALESETISRGTCSGGGGPLPVSCVAPVGYTKIYTAQDLSNIRNNLGGNYFLCNNINLGGMNWQPIAFGAGGYLWENGFSGILDGNNKKIIGLTIALTGDSQNYGFFAKISQGATVKNLHFVDPHLTTSNISDSPSVVGTLAGANSGLIKNCSVSGSGLVDTGTNGVVMEIGGLIGENVAFGEVQDSVIQSEVVVRGKNEIGGLVGRNNGTISNSEVSGTVIGEYMVGGLVGQHLNGDVWNSRSLALVEGIRHIGGFVGENNSEIDGSSSYAHVTGSDWGIGGFVGENGSSGEIKNSFAAAILTGSSNAQGLGGFVGSNYGIWPDYPAVIDKCYSLSNVSGGSGYIGAFAGKNSGLFSGSYFVTASYYNNEINPGLGSAAAQGRTIAEMTSVPQPANTYVGWDFSNVWWQIDGQFPQLR